MESVLAESSRRRRTREALWCSVEGMSAALRRLARWLNGASVRRQLAGSRVQLLARGLKIQKQKARSLWCYFSQLDGMENQPPEIKASGYAYGEYLDRLLGGRLCTLWGAQFPRLCS